jgi:hypothetical protein
MKCTEINLFLMCIARKNILALAENMKADGSYK